MEDFMFEPIDIDLRIEVVEQFGHGLRTVSLWHRRPKEKKPKEGSAFGFLQMHLFYKSSAVVRSNVQLE